MGSNFLSKDFFRQEKALGNIEIVEHISQIDFLKLINLVTNYAPTAAIIDLTNLDTVYEAEFKNLIKIFPKLNIAIIIDNEKEKQYKKLLKNLLDYIDDDISVFYIKRDSVNNLDDILDSMNYFAKNFKSNSEQTNKNNLPVILGPSSFISFLTDFSFIITDYICKKLNYKYKSKFERDVYAAIIGVTVYLIILFAICHKQIINIITH